MAIELVENVVAIRTDPIRVEPGHSQGPVIRKRECLRHLNEVVTYTFEAGPRGHFDVAKGQLNWTVGAYRALNTDDIINVASPIPGHEYFQNGGNTLHQGIEANATYKWDRWNLYAIHGLKLPMLLPGITISTSATDFAPIKQLQLEKFDGKTWKLFGEVISASGS